MKKSKIISLILFLVQAVLSVIFTVYIFKIGALPVKYTVAVMSALAVFLLIPVILILCRGTVKKIVSACISVLICAALILFIHYLVSTHSALKNLPGETNSYESDYEVIVRADDAARVLSDIKGYKIGIDTVYDHNGAKEALAGIENKIGSKLDSYEYAGTGNLLSALVETKEIDAMLIDHSFYLMLEESYEYNGDSIENHVKILENITVTLPVVPAEPTTPPKNDEPATLAPAGELWERPFVIYVSGIDVAGKITTRSRSDVNILIAINPNTKKMVLATVPRDTYVPFPGVTGGEYDKLTHAGIYGDNCSVSIATLEQYIYTGIKIDRWIRVNFTSLERMVDALGGITVESQFEFSRNGYSFVKGENYLNGKQALAFARNRKSFAEGDMQRGRNQLEVIKGIFKKAISPAILTAYTDILNEISDNIQTNLSYEDITGLVRMQLDDGASWDIETASIYVDYTYDYCYSMPGWNLCVGIMSEKSRLETVDKIQQVLQG